VANPLHLQGGQLHPVADAFYSRNPSQVAITGRSERSRAAIAGRVKPQAPLRTRAPQGGQAAMSSQNR
jgi:hypothetical protein